MELILSNIPPLRLTKRNIHSAFEELVYDADGMRIATGYVSADALAELKKIFEVNKKSFLELIIGMHGFDGFTRSQYEAAAYLNDYLKTKSAGEVRIATVLRFHGKVYSFLKGNKPFASIVGSSNLSSIFDDQNIYETNLLLQEPDVIKEIDDFISELSSKVCVGFNKWDTKIIDSKNIMLEGHEGIERVGKGEYSEVLSKRSSISFKIPIKADEAPQSNLNVYFGKGREDKRGFVKPRHWYEVELIVPKSITDNTDYPKAGYPDTESTITVYTDDGWKFECKISGQNSKNFRSANDLKILGRWMKGRLENSGALKVGERVTDAVLKKYGRSDFELIGTSDPKIWLLNFMV